MPPPAGFPWSKLLIALLVAGAVFGVVYFAVLKGEKTEKAEAACVILIDRTGSVDSPQQADRYIKAGDRAINTCRARKADVSVYYFDNHSAKLLAESDDQPIPLYLQKPELTGQSKQELQDRVDIAQGVIRTAMSHKPGAGRYTDILTTLNLASEELRSMASSAGVKDRYLLLVSDGVQNDGKVTMRPWNKDVPAGAAEGLVQTAEDYNRVPDVSGIDFTFVGVGDGVGPNGTQRSSEMEDAISGFWHQVIKLGGGKLCQYLPSNTTDKSIPGDC